MTVRSRLELFEQIRKAHQREGLGVRALARRFRTHRRYVRQALDSALPPARKVPERPSPVLDPWKPIIDEWLAADARAPKKQRHTARRVWQRLVAEHGAEVGESTVRRYVTEVRRGQPVAVTEVKVPQRHPLGEEAEVDFGRVSFVLAGVLTEGWMFVLRLSASGRAFHHVYLHQAQEAFLDGHVRAFTRLGGVPRRVRYDNLKPAVVRVLKGRDRTETERFVALRSHYGFDSFFCVPGIEGAHEKGGVEGEVGRFRRRHLVPMPAVATLAELNGRLAAADTIDDARRIRGRPLTVGEHFALETLELQPLPVEPFDVALMLSCRVDTKARVCVRQSFYSVPARFAGRRLDVRLGAGDIEVLDGGRMVASHERALGRGAEVLVLDHYLEVLTAKPGALPGSTALARARASGAFGPAHERFWVEARAQLGDGAGTRALIEVLLAHRTLPRDALLAGIDAALAVSSVNPEVVLIETRKAMAQPVAPVVPIGALTQFDRPAPSLNAYDELLEVGS